MSAIVIIGTGLAGYTTAREFRKLDAVTPLHLISRDDGSFYSKPILSNALALKKIPAQIALNTAADMERQLAATVSARSLASSIDPVAHHVTVNGETNEYSKLVLAVGADPIHPPLAGDAAESVMSVNDLSDYTRFRHALNGKRRIVILGAGLIGCEFANDLRSAEIEVDVIEPGTQPIIRFLPPQTANFLRSALEAAGVRFHFDTTAQSVMHATSGLAVALANGTTIETDLVLSATGLRPRVDLARDAGLEVDRGIVTNALLQTSAADVYALGDCAEVVGLNLPFVMPIMQAARVLAKTLHGSPTPVNYPAMPVVVKTPACPTVVCPPPPGIEGKWEESVAADGVRALFHDSAGTLRGFALVGSATKDKQALTKDIPLLLG
jgi:rubredoxin-NAD+ reductase